MYMKRHLRKESPLKFCWGAKLIILAAVLLFLVSPMTALGAEPMTEEEKLTHLLLKMPADVQINLFATGISSIRHMAFDDQGILYASRGAFGEIVALPDWDKDGKADEMVPLFRKRRPTYGLGFAQHGVGYYIYVAEMNRVYRMKRKSKPFRYERPEIIFRGIPKKGLRTRTLKIRNDKIYLSLGSTCDSCKEPFKIMGTVIRFDLKGKGMEIFARGFRNTTGIEFSPDTGELWGVNAGGYLLDHDRPYEELNIIRWGKHYGWPYCFEDRQTYPGYGEGFDCSRTEPPHYTFPAHTIPTGLAFHVKGGLPAAYDHNLFVSLKGSKRGLVPTGYRVVRLQLNEQGTVISESDFITGWLRPNGKPFGNPQDLIFSPEGDLYIADPKLKVIYRITGKNPIKSLPVKKADP